MTAAILANAATATPTAAVMNWSDSIQLAALLVTVMIFTIQAIIESRRRSKADRDALAATKVQIYQTLEMESNSIFRFEVDHKYILPYFKSHLAPVGLFARVDIMDNDNTLVTEAEMKLVARKYYEATCNLFEVSSRLRKANIADAEVFGSWVAWYFDTLLEWGFRAAWNGLRDNYTRDLRRIFDPFVARLRAEWDEPHHAGQAVEFAHPPTDKGRLIDDETIRKLRVDFYCEVAKLFGNTTPQDEFDRRVALLSQPDARYEACIHIEKWLEMAEATAPKPDHPMAYA